MAKIVPHLAARGYFLQRLLLGMFFRPIRLFCEHCDKYVPSDMHWRCGHCDSLNEWTKIYSFLNKCQHCKRPPRACECPHCNSLIYFDSDRIGSHAARAPRAIPQPTIELSPPLPVIVDIETKAQAEHDANRAALLREIELTELKKKLATLKASPEFQKEKTRLEKYLERWDEKMERRLGLEMFEERLKKAFETSVADNPEFRSKMEEALQELREEEML